MTIRNTQVFVSEIPLACVHEIEQSVLKSFTLKHGLNPTRKSFKIGWYHPDEFPNGSDIISDSVIDNPRTIVTVEGKYSNQCALFFSQPLKRDGIDYEFNSTRFWRFPTPTLDIGISQFLTKQAYENIDKLFQSELGEIDLLRWLSRHADKISRKDSDRIYDWILKSRSVPHSEYLTWCKTNRIAVSTLNDLNNQIERILNNDVL